MLALYRGGRQADAPDAASSLRERLFEQLGVSPSPQLVELEHAILNHERSLRTG